MPNHFITIGLCGRDWARGSDDDMDFSPLNGANLCKLVAPMPSALEGIVVGNPLCRYIHKTTREVSMDFGERYGVARNQWDQVPLADAEIANLHEEWGASNWLDWATDNWGTKWGAYDTKVHELETDGAPILVEFQSAWRPPSPIMMGKITDYLCETYYLKNIKWIGHNPYDSSVVDVAVARESLLPS